LIPFVPVLGAPRPRLGQLSALTSGLTGGLTDTIAQKIVAEAEPATRRVIRDERNRLAEALIGAIPFLSISAIAFVGTKYLVHDDAAMAKFIGYGSSAAAAGGGALWTFSRMTETTTAPPPSAAPTAVTEVAIQAAQAIVTGAEPKIRAIVQEERARISEAAIIGIPFWAGSAVAFAATAFMVEDTDNFTKTLGYSASALLFALGGYVALNKERT
jgi:hypothetical protein